MLPADVEDSRRDTLGVEGVDDGPALIGCRRRGGTPEAVVDLAGGGHVDGQLDPPDASVVDLADQGVPHARPVADAVEVARPLDPPCEPPGNTRPEWCQVVRTGTTAAAPRICRTCSCPRAGRRRGRSPGRPRGRPCHRPSPARPRRPRGSPGQRRPQRRAVLPRRLLRQW